MPRLSKMYVLDSSVFNS